MFHCLPRRVSYVIVFLLCSFLLATVPTLAQAPGYDLVAGPAQVDLGSEAELDLDAGYLFADGDDTRIIMESMGNVSTNREVGLVAPNSADETWFLVFEYEPVGYVEDSDQEEIDADALFDQMYEATEASNAIRRERGFSPLHLERWVEEPHYDEASHNLVWATLAKDDVGEQYANYNMRVLGRRGYTSVTLVADPAELESLKPEMARLMSDFSYKTGSRYADFTQGDKLAGYGLTALIAGGAGAAAAKLGLFATLDKFFAKMWKLLVLVVIGLLSGIKRFFGGKSASPADEENPPFVPGAS